MAKCSYKVTIDVHHLHSRIAKLSYVYVSSIVNLDIIWNTCKCVLQKMYICMYGYNIHMWWCVRQDSYTPC